MTFDPAGLDCLAEQQVLQGLSFLSLALSAFTQARPIQSRALGSMQ